ncbi:MAG TPA: GAF domain-containing sensor histidine kinase [Leptolyngbyaceae cyanobacterium]
MILPASPEFIDLCQSQAYLLAQALNATSTAIYLAERSAGHPSPTLIPIVVHPELSANWAAMDWPVAAAIGLLPEAGSQAAPTVETSNTDLPSETAQDSAFSIADKAGVVPPANWLSGHQSGLSEHQMVLPLAHEGLVLGVLVSTREGKPWQREERQQAEQVAHTLTLARVLDQRGQWFEQRLHQKQLTQSHQSETMHDLLHQFRNPLTALRTFGKLLLKRMQSEDANHPIAEGIVRESERLQDLIQHFDEAVAVGDADIQEGDQPPSSAILALPAADQRALPMSTTRSQSSPDPDFGPTPGSHLGAILAARSVQIAEILRPLLISADAVAQEKQIQVSAEIPDDLPPVWADHGALREVVSNLLDNALKYSPPKAQVWVRAGLFREEAGNTYQGIAVGDTGPGIPSADQSHIFERHYRGVQAVGSIPGTGLGLAIAYDLVRDMSGQLNLLSPASLSGLVPDTQNTATGPGTVFIIWLPQKIS